MKNSGATFLDRYSRFSVSKLKKFTFVIPLVFVLIALAVTIGIGETTGDYSNGVNVGIVSNKKNEATRLICEKLLGGLYDYAHGAVNEEERKPKPDMVYDAMAHFGASKDETVYVGDSNVDIETARNAGIDCISVTWGYRDKAALEKAGATAFAEDAKQLPALLKAL